MAAAPIMRVAASVVRCLVKMSSRFGFWLTATYHHGTRRKYGFHAAVALRFFLVPRAPVTHASVSLVAREPLRLASPPNEGDQRLAAHKDCERRNRCKRSAVF